MAIVERTVPRLSQAQVIPGHLVLYPGETTLLRPAAYDQQGREFDDVQFSWNLVDPTVGTITAGGVFSAGLATGVYPNAISLIATPTSGGDLGPVEGRAGITVIAPRSQAQAASLRLIPEKVEVTPGEKVQLFAYALDSVGTLVPDVNIRWSMAEPAAGSVSDSGVLQGGTQIGDFSGAVVASIGGETGGEGRAITATADVTLLDPQTAGPAVTAAALPRLISLRPGQQTQFSVLVLDERGRQVAPLSTRWETLDSRAGTVAENGRFHAAEEPEGIFTDAVQATTRVVHNGEELSLEARATVVLVKAAQPIEEPGRLQEVAIYPSRVTLSPGESARLSVISLDGNGNSLDQVQVSWTLDPSLGRISSNGNLIASDAPGVYEGSIRADVHQPGDTQGIEATVTATLTIRGELVRAEIFPSKAILVPGGRVGFRAVGYDANGITLPDVIARWRVIDQQAGRIDGGGAFVASDRLGNYPDAVEVELVQRLEDG